MNKAWVVRPYPHNIYRMAEFKQRQIVAIGWPGIGDLTGKTRTDIKKFLMRAGEYESPQSLGQAAGIIDRFVNKIQMDDYVIVPDGPCVYIGRVSSAYQYAADKDNTADGYSHQRRINWVNEARSIDKGYITGRMANSLKGRQAVFSTYADDIAELLTKKAHLFTGLDYSELKQQYLCHLQDGTLIGVNPNTFEDAVGVVLRRYYPQLTRQSTTGSKEGDTDLMTALPGGVVVRIQVKHFFPEHGELQPWVVDQLAQSMDDCDHGIIVTSGVVSQNARARAKELLERESKQIAFIEGGEFVDLVFENIEDFTSEEQANLGLSKRLDLL